MPITIKEILFSDSISDQLEKINFNFDQLILAGGGPPGPQGPVGSAGPVGPRGYRGDHWFAGSSALGQTADHDGGSLQIQDHFLDSNGNVYYYTGSTWNASGVNLKGTTGAVGATGGGLDWNLYLPATAGLGGAYYGPITASSVGSSLIDFLVPSVNQYKNSIFIGDPEWAYLRLNNFGINPYQVGATASGESVPKFTIIQKEINEFGINGISFGAYGVTSSITGNSSYGSTGSTADFKDFVYGSFVNESIGGGNYQTKWKLSSLRMPIKIQAGDAAAITTSGTIGQINTPIEVVATDIDLKDYSLNKQIKITQDTSVTLSSYFSNYIRSININSLPNQSILSPTGGTNYYGYIGIQNIEGSLGSTGTGWPEHQYGNVIIGPTNNGTQPLAITNPQGLAIVRKITTHNTVDAGLRFFQTSLIGATYPNSSIHTSITPVRISDTYLGNKNLDTLTISTGFGPSGLNGLDTAGRIGISNASSGFAFKPQFGFHVSLHKDAGMGVTAWDGGSSYAGLSYFFAGFDVKDTYGQTSLRNSGIGFANIRWTDGLTGTTGGNGTYINPIIQGYYRNDTATTLPNDGASGQSQGILSPHIYLQVGGESQRGNVGLGFSPSSSYSLGPTYNGSDFALAKLSINGSITIGSTTSGYHKISTHRGFNPNGILIEGAIIQGATTMSSQIGTSWYGSTAVNGSISISASMTGWISAKAFLTRGEVGSTAPDYAFSDMRTGIGYSAGQTGTGWLMAASIIPTVSGSTGPTANSVKVASWRSIGEYGYTGNVDYGNLRADSTFAMQPATYTLNTLPIKITNIRATVPPFTYRWWKRTWFEIPSRNSTIFLDLTDPYSSYINNTGNWVNVGVGYGIYLNGDYVNTTTSSSSLPPGGFWVGNYSSWNQYGFTVEDGHYDGQILRIMVTDVAVANQSLLESNGVPIAGSVGGYVTSLASYTVKDKLILAADPISSYTAGNSAYPLPYGYSGTWYNSNQWSSGASSGIYASGSPTGYGMFRILPYRSLTLQWKFDYDATYPTNLYTKGAWYEIGRENLVQRQSRTLNIY